MQLPTPKRAMQHACLFVTQPLQLVTASVKYILQVCFQAKEKCKKQVKTTLVF
jgi:hypothetical protein